MQSDRSYVKIFFNIYHLLMMQYYSMYSESYYITVQMQVIPYLLESVSTGFHIGRAGYRPSDICVSAPTGSGKTLAFVLPIVQVNLRLQIILYWTHLYLLRGYGHSPVCKSYLLRVHPFQKGLVYRIANKVPEVISFRKKYQKSYHISISIPINLLHSGWKFWLFWVPEGFGAIEFLSFWVQ